jgi:RNA polymerase sigma-70 factor (ECF subfamily)
MLGLGHIQLLRELFDGSHRIKGMEQEEKDIIAAIIQGSDRYEELVRRYSTGLIIHCEHLVGDRDDAEDIAQEAFVKAYTNLAKFNPDKARFSTWLYKIAGNVAIDFLRTQRRRVNTEDIETMAEATMPAYIEEERQQEIIQAVQALRPPEFGRAIEAYFWQGKSYQQIADQEHIPINTVRSRLRRAKLQLKEKLL